MYFTVRVRAGFEYSRLAWFLVSFFRFVFPRLWPNCELSRTGDSAALELLRLISIGDISEPALVDSVARHAAWALAVDCFAGGAAGANAPVQALVSRPPLSELGETVRGGEATAEEHYELGAVLLRKKMFTPAIDNLQKALELWESEDDQERAQAHNALGFALFQQKKHQQAAEQYACAIELDPTYLTAWKNLGNVYEAQNQLRKALGAYKKVLEAAPEDRVARERVPYLEQRCKALRL